MNNLAIMFLVFFFTGLATAQIDFWKQTNGPNAGEVYCFSKDSLGFVFAGSDNGLYRSSDQGQTWRKLDLIASYVQSLAINQNGYLIAGSLTGVNISTDHGNTWSPINNGLTNLAVNCITIDHEGNLFVGTRGGGVFFLQYGASAWVQRNIGLPNQYITCASVGASGSIVVGTDSTGLYRSIDKGLTWNPSVSGLTNHWTNVLTSDKSGTFFVATQAGVFRSTDDALTWVQTNNGLTNTLVWGLQANSVGQVFAGTLGGYAFRSTDNGDSWVQIFYELGNMQRAFTVTMNGYILLGAYYGLYRSTDDGGSWSLVGLPKTQIIALLSDQSGIILALTRDYGLAYTSDNGISWNQIPHLYFRCVASNRNGVLYAGGGQGVYQSRDTGETWNLLGGQIAGGILSLLANPTGVMYAGADIITTFDGASGGGLYKSTDAGLNWKQIAFAGKRVSTLALNSSGIMFASVGDFLVRSGEADTIWQSSFDPMYVTSLAFKSNGQIYAGSSVNGLYFSSDNGDTWSRTDLDRTNIQSIFVSPDDAVYCGTQGGGLYVRREYDTSFTQLNSGLTSQGVLTLSMDKSGFLYAGTFDCGVFRSTSAITGVGSHDGGMPKAFALYQSYPNPFNPSTTIRYELPRSSFVTLSIYNILGQKVALLVHEQEGVGFHQVIFRNDGLSSGVYLYRLQAKDYVATKKMLLLK